MAAKKEPTTAPEVPEEVKGPKMVKIRLFKDSGKYSNDVYVGVNGESWLIKRGVEVEVPYYVAEVIEQSIKQDDATAELIHRESTAAKNADALI